MADPKIVPEGTRLALTQSELDTLKILKDAGDRGGFYMAYYGMTGNSEVLLTAKIATFSEATGGVAFAANRLLLDDFTTGPLAPGSSKVFQGIYCISQGVADFTYQTVAKDLDPNYAPAQGTPAIPSRTADSSRDGLTSQNQLYVAAFDKWRSVDNGTLFPGNFLTAQSGLAQWLQGRDYTHPDVTATQAGASTGFVYSAKATLYASYFGKQQSEMSASTVVAGPDGYNLTVAADGKVDGVFGNTQSDILATVAALAAQARTAFGPTGTADGRALLDIGGFAAFGSDWTTVRTVWAAEVPVVEAKVRQILGLGATDPITESALAAFRKGLYEGGPNSGGDAGRITNERLLRLPELVRTNGVSRATIYR